MFENFNTIDGDFLTAKFKAFKFPESTYVQFKGTVNVCLDKCKGVRIVNEICLRKFIHFGFRWNVATDKLVMAEENEQFQNFPQIQIKYSKFPSLPSLKWVQKMVT